MSDEDNVEQRGTIVWAAADGGMMTIVVKDAEGKQHRLLGDNGPTVRALMNLFGREIVSGHTLLVNRIIGKDITYGVDEFGVLAFIAE